MLHGTGQRGPGDLGADVPARAGRSRQLGYEFAKFGVIGVTGIFITNGIYDLLFIHLAGDAVALPLVGFLSDRFGIAKAVIILPIMAVIGGIVVLGGVRTVGRDMARVSS